MTTLLDRLRPDEHNLWLKLEALKADEAKVTSERDKLLAQIHGLVAKGKVPPITAGPPQKFVQIHRFYDDVAINLIPTNAEAVAGYVGGSWPTEDELLRLFPHAKHVSIAVNAGEKAEILDIEPGDAVPSQGAPWIKDRLNEGVWRPGAYGGASTLAVVAADLRRMGIPRSSVRLWLADWVGFPQLLPGYDAQQYTDKALGRSLDESMCLGSFFR